jgi:hypothetical protein
VSETIEDIHEGAVFFREFSFPGVECSMNEGICGGLWSWAQNFHFYFGGGGFVECLEKVEKEFVAVVGGSFGEMFIEGVLDAAANGLPKFGRAAALACSAFFEEADNFREDLDNFLLFGPLLFRPFLKESFCTACLEKPGDFSDVSHTLYDSVGIAGESHIYEAAESGWSSFLFFHFCTVDV